MSRPVWVQVIWSESGAFEENELMPFIDFEILALDAVIGKGKDEGYWKTKIKVLFDDGNSYECILDLASDCIHGFMHHAKNLIDSFENSEDDGGSEYYFYEKNYRFLRQIVWPALPEARLAD